MIDVCVEQWADKAYPSFSQVLCPNINNSASHSFGRVETERVILIPLPRIKHPLRVDGSFVYRPWNCYIYELTALGEKQVKS